MQITNISERRIITTNFIDIKKITKEYYEQIYVNKFGNFKKLAKFLNETTKLTQGETDNLNRLTYFKKEEL